MAAKLRGHSVDTVLVKGSSPKVRIIPLPTWPPYSMTLLDLTSWRLVGSPLKVAAGKEFGFAETG